MSLYCLRRSLSLPLKVTLRRGALRNERDLKDSASHGMNRMAFKRRQKCREFFVKEYFVAHPQPCDVCRRHASGCRLAGSLRAHGMVHHCQHLLEVCSIHLNELEDSSHPGDAAGHAERLLALPWASFDCPELSLPPALVSAYEQCCRQAHARREREKESRENVCA